jgi:thymidine phosphorylase
MKGVLFLIVGADGAGKNTLLDGARKSLNADRRFTFARRVITRPVEVGGEAHEAIDAAEFDKRVKTGRFFAHWRAHDYCYGLPAEIADTLDAGQNVLANVSRTAIDEIAGKYDDIRVIEVTAPLDIRAKRLANRADVARRLSRQPDSFATGIEVLTVETDTTPEESAARFVDAVIRSIPGRLKVRLMRIDTWRDNICFLHRDCAAYPAPDYLGPGKIDIFTDSASIRARVNLTDDAKIVGRDEIGLSKYAFEQLGLPEGTEVMLERTPAPESLPALRGKVAGEELSLDQMRMVIRDIVDYRYTEREIAAFLVAAAKDLSV